MIQIRFIILNVHKINTIREENKNYKNKPNKNKENLKLLILICINIQQCFKNLLLSLYCYYWCYYYEKFELNFNINTFMF